LVWRCGVHTSTATTVAGDVRFRVPVGDSVVVSTVPPTVAVSINAIPGTITVVAAGTIVVLVLFEL
jgi:hypothetical protein